MLSTILAAATHYPSDENVIMGVLGSGSVLASLVWAALALFPRGKSVAIDRTGRDQWQMPLLDRLTTPVMSASRRIWMGGLRGYLLLASGPVLIRIVELVLRKGG